MAATPLINGDTRKPLAGHLTYAPGVRPDPQTPMGPNTLGEMLWPVTVEDLDDGWRELGTDAGGATAWVGPEGADPIPEPKGARTRVGFAYAAPTETAA